MKDVVAPLGTHVDMLKRGFNGLHDPRIDRRKGHHDIIAALRGIKTGQDQWPGIANTLGGGAETILGHGLFSLVM